MTKAMVLAAGRGTRLQEFTQDTPKPLVPVAGVAPLKRTLSLLSYRGYTQVVVNAWYLAHKIKEATEKITSPNVTVVEEPNLLDTGGGIKNALTHLGGAPFLVINGDLIWSEETHPILAQLPGLFDPEKMDGLLLLIPRHKAQGYYNVGDFYREEDGRLRSKTHEEAQAPYVYSGIQVLHPRLFDDHHKTAFPLPEAYRTAMEKGRLYGHVYDGEWVDMGTPEGMRLGGELVTRLKSSSVA